MVSFAAQPLMSMAVTIFVFTPHPGKRSKLDEKASKLLFEDLRWRPRATHAQRAEFVLAVCGVRVSEATICRAIKRLSHSRKKDPKEAAERDEFLRVL